MKSTFPPPLSHVGTAAMRRAANDKAQTVLEINRNHFYNLLSKNLFLAKEIQALAFNRMNKDQNRILK